MRRLGIIKPPIRRRASQCLRISASGDARPFVLSSKDGFDICSQGVFESHRTKSNEILARSKSTVSVRATHLLMAAVELILKNTSSPVP